MFLTHECWVTSIKATLISVALITSMGFTANSYIYPSRWVILLCLISENAKAWNRFPFCKSFYAYVSMFVCATYTQGPLEISS